MGAGNFDFRGDEGYVLNVDYPSVDEEDEDEDGDEYVTNEFFYDDLINDVREAVPSWDNSYVKHFRVGRTEIRGVVANGLTHVGLLEWGGRLVLTFTPSIPEGERGHGLCAHNMRSTRKKLAARLLEMGYVLSKPCGPWTSCYVTTENLEAML